MLEHILTKEEQEDLKQLIADFLVLGKNERLIVKSSADALRTRQEMG